MTTEAIKLNRMENEPNLERRDYPLDFTSVIVDFSDLAQTPPYPSDCMHYHNCLELGICLSGGGTVTVGSEIWTYAPGTVLLMPRGVRHAQQNTVGNLIHWRYLAINEDRLLSQVSPACREPIAQMLSDTGNRCLLFENMDLCPEIEFYFNRIFDWYHRYGSAARPEIETCLTLLLTRMAHQSEQTVLGIPVDPYTKRPIEPALTYVAEHYAQPFTVSQLASCCAMSESHFRKTFLRLMDVPPLEYVNRYRIHRAMSLLRVSNNTVTGVAIRCGFPSTASFNRNFRLYVGETPTEWRKRRGVKNKFAD